MKMADVYKDMMKDGEYVEVIAKDESNQVF